MSAVVDFSTGKGRALDRIPEAPTPLTERDVQDAPTLVRLVSGLLRDVAKILGRWRPRYIDFTQVVSAGTSIAPEAITLEHRFGSDVRWWVVDVRPPGAVTTQLIIRPDADDLNVLRLNVYFAATLTIRVEEAG